MSLKHVQVIFHSEIKSNKWLYQKKIKPIIKNVCIVTLFSWQLNILVLQILITVMLPDVLQLSLFQ